MTARWHLGPITGAYFWWILVTSPEILVFLFFMITDPRTTPSGRGARVVRRRVGLLAALLIAPMQTEYATKVAVLGSLTVVCAVRPLLARFPLERLGRRRLALAGAAALAVYAGVLVGGGIAWRAPATATCRVVARAACRLSRSSRRRASTAWLDRKTSRQLAADLVAGLRLQTSALSERRLGELARATTGEEQNALTNQIRAAANGTIEVPAYRLDRMRVHLEAGHGQGPVGRRRRARRARWS